MIAATALPHRHYSFAEDLANGLLQGAAALLAIAGLAVLVGFAALRGGALAVVACAVFGAALVLLWLISTVYHAIPDAVAPAFLERLDHIGILLLIAGTYTPFALLALGGTAGWWLFGVVWGLALVGAVLQFVSCRRAFSIGLYLLMGWLALAVFQPLAGALGAGGTTLLLAGGAAYTLGVPFYLCKRLRFHFVFWHAFVLAGSTLHFFAVLLYVLP